MQILSKNEIINLILQINTFADNAENLISANQADYQSKKNALAQKQSAELSTLENKYKAYCASVRQKAEYTIKQANFIMDSIQKLDTRLSSVDKYYVKTKKKKEMLLAETTSQDYEETTDYFEALAEIQKSYNVLYKKYSEDILPKLLNGLNYIFSNQRKKDYEELIILKNTVSAFVKEIQAELPPITEESLQSIRNSYNERRDSVQRESQSMLSYIEAEYQKSLDRVADAIYNSLDSVLPDELVNYFYSLSKRYAANLKKVNNGDEITDDILGLLYITYPVDFFVNSKIVSSIIKDKCSSLLANENAIQFPAAVPVQNTAAIMINNDGSNSTAVQEFIHSIMFSVLSYVPVSELCYTIIDPENRGNSVAPFFDARKKLPELFDEKIYVSREDIAQKLKSINGKIEETMQYRLGTKYNSIFDWLKDNPDMKADVQLLVLFDFPREFDERMLADLRNILRNGSRCGIFTVISFRDDAERSYSTEYQNNIQAIRELTTVIEQNNTSFLMSGLPISYNPMPDRAEFEKYFSKYMLVYEGIQNRGIAFSPLVKKLVEAKSSDELSKHIELICDMMDSYEKEYACVPGIKAGFPPMVMLGTVLYPADVFSDSIDYQKILKIFGTEEQGGDQNNYIELPMTFDLRSSFNLLLTCPEVVGREIRAFTHHVIWSFLSFIPVTKVNVCICDPEQRGNSIVPFLDFRKRCPQLFDEKIYTDSDAIHDKLRQINTHIDDFILEKLGNKYQDIMDYNVHTPKRAEALTLLVLYDFPGGMDGRSIELLNGILRNGNRCGVFTIICHNPDVSFSRYESIDERLETIKKYCVPVEYKDRSYRLLPYNLRINIPEPLDYASTDRFIVEYAARSEKLQKQGISFEDIVPSEMFAADSSKSLRIPVGIGSGDAVVDLVLGEGSSHHVLIAGATGGGKSTLLHTIIMSSMLQYSPDQLNLYLMDFKSGTEFKVYESVKLPQIKLLALDAMQEFGESILENLVSEMEDRGKLFKEAGQTSLKGYVQATGKSLPRILIIMDEFQILYNDSTNRKVAYNCAELTKRIVTEGRAFGIHLLMATQSTKVISDLTLSRGTVEQMRIRIGLKCGEDDARYMFGDSAAKASSMMKGPLGIAVMNPDYTEKENTVFRTAYCDGETQKEYLEVISSAFQSAPYTLQIFEGNRNVYLLDYLRDNAIGFTGEKPVRIHLGSLIKVAPPFEVAIDKKRKHNMLICGSSERMSGILFNDYLISAALNHNTAVYCIDGDILIDEDTYRDYYEVLSEECSGFHYATDIGDVIRFINSVYEEYQNRKKHNGGETIFVMIKNLQFLEIVKSMLKGETIDESEYKDEEPAWEPEEDSANPFAALNNMFAARANDDNMGVSEKLIKMIADGTGYGIHFVINSLEYQTVRETMYYGENVLTRFPERIIFSLGENDADSLIENVSVSGLRDNTVIYTDGVKNTYQLKPYIPPKPEELRAFLEDARNGKGESVE